MELVQAQAIADEFVKVLSPACSRIMICGSIRRKKILVHDIDIVGIPSNQGQLLGALQSLGKIKSGAGKMIRVGMGFTRGIDLDFYVATPETWATLILIRTGSKEHNFRLCMRAS